MTRLRKYGSKPYSVILLHGGPGAAGYLKPVAKVLSTQYGVIEPFQSKLSINELVNELDEVINMNPEYQVVLIGHSWGALLGFIYASKFPENVKKLILVGSAPFEDKYALDIPHIRNARMNNAQNEKFKKIEAMLTEPNTVDKDSILIELGNLITQADSYDLNDSQSDVEECSFDMFVSVWQEALILRKEGGLLSLSNNIRCPVACIHGYDDPHPYKGVTEPLSERLSDFTFTGLNKCGHEPWKEKFAADEFYKVLFNELVL